MGAVQTIHDNSRPLDFSRWSEAPEIERVVEAVYAECRAHGLIQREKKKRGGQQGSQRDCLKLILLNLYLNHKSDPTRLTRYSRNKCFKLVPRYNPANASVAQVIGRVDHLEELGYAVAELGDTWNPSTLMKQSTMRATDKLIELFEAEKVTPLMVSTHSEAETVILKDKRKKLMDYVEDSKTQEMRKDLERINKLIAGALINLNMSDADLKDLNHRMVTGELSPGADYEDDDGTEGAESTEAKDLEAPRGAIDFASKGLRRIFNNGTFENGGRLYGGWWQAIPGKATSKDPRSYRKYIKISQLDTVEVDFSAMHLNLIYWKAGIPVESMPDLYELEGFPADTRDAVKACVLTLINAKSRKKGMESLKQRVLGVKRRYNKTTGTREETPVAENDRIKVPDGITLEAIVDAFEKNHSVVAKEWFFTGKGVELQRYDSDLAVKILLKLADKSIVCLPVHDSFLVVHWHEEELGAAMSEAFFEMTGRYPKMETKKDSMLAENKAKGEKVLEREYQEKMQGGAFSRGFRETHSVYVRSVEEWHKAKGYSLTTRLSLSGFIPS